jgi:rfaE bifunctional protein nucleotidyltransferase chain/domain
MQNLTTLDRIKNKVLKSEDLNQLLSRWRFFSKKIVFTNGCFDILHLGHIDYLAKAAEEGNVLIVGLNSDASTSKLKGPGRPINNEQQRSMILASLLFVDAVVIFDEPTPLELIKLVQPDVLIKGSDYKPEEIVGYDIVTAKKGLIKTIDFLEGYSTTRIEEKIRSGGKS